jgi:TRAP-type transport system periplasmic protein
MKTIKTILGNFLILGLLTVFVMNGDLWAAEKITYTGPPITLRFSSHVPLSHGINKKVFIPFFKMIEEKSNGKLIVKSFLDKTLHGQTDGFKACVADITDYTHGYVTYQAASFHLMHVTELPFAFSNSYMAALISEELYPQYFKKEYEKLGVYMANTDATAPSNILSMKPIRKLEDLKGLKIRTAGGVATEVIKAMGAVPLVVAGPELYTAFQRGMIDALLIGTTDLIPYRLHQLAKYFTVAQINLSTPQYMLNKKTFDNLPPDLKRLFYDALRVRSQMAVRDFYVGENLKTGMEEIQKAGVEIITLPPEELKRWKNASQPLWDKFIAENEAKGLPAKKLVEDLKSLSEKYSTLAPDQIWEKVNKQPTHGMIDGM